MKIITIILNLVLYIFRKHIKEIIFSQLDEMRIKQTRISLYVVAMRTGKLTLRINDHIAELFRFLKHPRVLFIFVCPYSDE